MTDGDIDPYQQVKLHAFGSPVVLERATRADPAAVILDSSRQSTKRGRPSPRPILRNLRQLASSGRCEIQAAWLGPFGQRSAAHSPY